LTIIILAIFNPLKINILQLQTNHFPLFFSIFVQFAKAQLLKSIDELKTHITTQLKTTVNTSYKGHLLLALERMKSPEKAKPTLHQAPPPGSPIGCGEVEN